MSKPALYFDPQIKISRKYLELIIKELSRPPCLLGGWAVSLQMNDKFNSSKGRDYIGSKDIDLGFHLDPKWSKQEYEDSDLRKAISTIESLGFEAVSFRYLKQFANDGTELTEVKAQSLASYDLFALYIDLIVDTAEEERHNMVGFSIAEEPLLQNVFSGNQKSTVDFLGLNVVLPDPSLLLEMKVNSFPDRTQDDKKTKDLTDICALLLYSDTTTLTLQGLNEQGIARRNKFERAIRALPETEWDNVSRLLDEDKSELKRVIARSLR